MGTFQIFSVIVMLNLLIATMNTTVQKLEDKKYVYWKFVKTSVWMDYFDEYTSISPPYTILRIPCFILLGLTMLTKMILTSSCIAPLIQGTAVGSYFTRRETLIEGFVPDDGHNCVSSERHKKQRLTHANVMLTLLQRYHSRTSDEDGKNE